MRLITSSDEPAGKPQIILIGRVGYGSCARATEPRSRPSVSIANPIHRVISSSSQCSLPIRLSGIQHLESALLQSCPAETLQIVFPLFVQLDRHLACNPGERNIGLRAAKLLQRGLGDVFLADHACGGSQHPVRADEIAALPDALARKTHRLV